MQGLELPAKHPLAAAMENASSADLWLVLKDLSATKKLTPPVLYRARVTKWTRHESTVTIELEPWEEYAERQAQQMGL